jgi:hypothetical protein
MVCPDTVGICCLRLFCAVTAVPARHHPPAAKPPTASPKIVASHSDVAAPTQLRQSHWRDLRTCCVLVELTALLSRATASRVRED